MQRGDSVAEEVKRNPQLTLGDTRAAMLHHIQQLTVEWVRCAPIMDFRALHGIGPRAANHTINAIPMHPFPSYEDIRLKVQ